MPSPIVYFQIGSEDAEATAAFCREVFDWDIGESAGAVTPVDTHAREIDPNDIFVSGSVRQLREGAAPFVSLYVRVADLDGTIEKALARGADLVVPRQDPEGGASVAVIREPLGHTFGVIQL
jgi:predicted enzyme related to lactoylglutathione lyase